jgi:hypothetical protein
MCVGGAAAMMKHIVHSDEIGNESKLKVRVERSCLACEEIV